MTISAGSPKKIDFLYLGNDKAIQVRCENVSKHFEFHFASLDDINTYFDRSDDFAQTGFIIVSAANVEVESEIAGMVQVLRQVANDAFIGVIVGKRLKPESAVFVKKSGASIVLGEHEVVETCVLEFIASQRIKSSMVPMKTSELVKGTSPDFTIFHMLPLNRKFLPVFPANTEITEGKLKKVETVGEVYLNREDVSRYRAYVEKYQDKSAAGLKSRCRAKFLEFSSAYIDLILLMVDQSEFASFEQGKILYDRCCQFAADLLVNLSSVGDAWEVISNSSIGDFGSVERAPAVAAYAGLYSLLSGLGKAEEAMIAALIADIGLLDLTPKTFLKLKNYEKLSEEDLKDYQKHPLLSVNKALSRKLPLPDKIKTIIMATHERTDGKGFPNQLHADKVGIESQLIHFSEMVDKGSLIEWGKERTSSAEVQKKIFLKEFEAGGCFSLVFLNELKNIFV